MISLYEHCIWRRLIEGADGVARGGVLDGAARPPLESTALLALRAHTPQRTDGQAAGAPPGPPRGCRGSTHVQAFRGGFGYSSLPPNWPPGILKQPYLHKVFL